MADLDRIKDECDEKPMLFESLLRMHDPSGMDPVVVQGYYQRWDEELSSALMSLAKSVRNMTTSHKVALGTTVINAWKQHISESEKKYRDHRAATFLVVKSAESREVPIPVSRPLSATAPEVTNSSTRSRTAEVEIAIEAERVAQEGKELDNEVKGYDDWGNGYFEEKLEPNGQSTVRLALTLTQIKKLRDVQQRAKETSFCK